MSVLSVISILFGLVPVFGLLHYHRLSLPNTVGPMVVALFSAALRIGLDALFPHLGLRDRSQEILGTQDLPNTLLNGALSFLLFAGALSVDVNALWQRKITIL